jgi:predicted DNA-binding protein YlxM (UPF0122 family)
MSDAKHAEAVEDFLQNALGDLSDKQRFVVECYFGMRDSDPMSTRQIAELMGISHVSVARLLNRAMSRLQSTYEGLQDRYTRELNLPIPPVGEAEAEDGEQVCSSPFIPSDHGMTPKSGYKLLSDWDDEHDSSRWPPAGFSVGRLEEL